MKPLLSTIETISKMAIHKSFLVSFYRFEFYCSTCKFFILIFSDSMSDRPESSRMTIRRNRTPPTTGRILTSANSLISDEISAATSSSSSRYRNKRFSVPVATRGGYDGGISALDLNAASEDIERRRRRIRSISNSAPPIPVPSIYRGYLSKSSARNYISSSAASSMSTNDSSSFSRLENGIQSRLFYSPNQLVKVVRAGDLSLSRGNGNSNLTRERKYKFSSN